MKCFWTISGDQQDTYLVFQRPNNTEYMHAVKVILQLIAHSAKDCKQIEHFQL